MVAKAEAVVPMGGGVGGIMSGGGDCEGCMIACRDDFVGGRARLCVGNGGVVVDLGQSILLPAILCRQSYLNNDDAGCIDSDSGVRWSWFVVL